jgi:hypothetical protein
LFSPQALQEERKAEDCSPSRLARQVGSEVSTSGQRWQQHRLLRWGGPPYLGLLEMLLGFDFRWRNGFESTADPENANEGSEKSPLKR